MLDKQLIYLVGIYTIATICTFALDWQLPGFSGIAEFSKKIDLDRYLIKDYMTYWQLTHFLTRFVLGYFCPDYWQLIFAIDFGWESIECFKWEAHNWYDLIWNMLGLIIGIMVRYYGLIDKFLNRNNEKEGETDANETNTNARDKTSNNDSNTHGVDNVDESSGGIKETASPKDVSPTALPVPNINVEKISTDQTIDPNLVNNIHYRQTSSNVSYDSPKLSDSQPNVTFDYYDGIPIVPTEKRKKHKKKEKKLKKNK